MNLNCICSYTCIYFHAHYSTCDGCQCRRAVEEETETGPSVKDMDDAVEAFMKRQAELESGGMPHSD